MLADDRSLAPPLPQVQRHELLRVVVPALVLLAGWWLAMLLLPAFVWVGLICYALAHLALMLLDDRTNEFTFQVRAGLSLLLDGGLALLILVYASRLSESAIFPLYLLIALRALLVYQRLPAAMITPFVLGPVYVFGQVLNRSSLSPTLFERSAYWLLLLGSLTFGTVAIWSSAKERRANKLLRQSLLDAQGATESRVAQVERTANDLRARMREQHALEEGLRVITSTLSLDEVLSQIVDSTIQMLGTARVHGVALSLDTPNGFEHRSFMLDDHSVNPWAAMLAGRVMQQQVPLIIGDVRQTPELVDVIPPDVCAALSLPLFASGGAARGALTVVSTVNAAFSSSDARHLAAFANQAGIAIGNAELHSQIRQQQHLLAAVMRDISDGLIVLDTNAQIVLTNPLGRAILDGVAGTPVSEQLFQLATTMRTADNTTLTCEVRSGIEIDEVQPTYLAIASRVWQEDADEPLTAIVLHDITAQKAQERNRVEFISMVAHELRNPLHSMGGFIKVVLEGRAGALQPMQQEFLEIADQQVARLNGRIGELLEFNRVDANRLRLNPQWGALAELVQDTVARLRLQAEQNGLALASEIEAALPECYFDSERIGQVVTNLIENAFKATPAGGAVHVQTELHGDEVWVRVADTGVGIPAEEQSKIFQAFYRAHDRTSSRGNHLGLGLAICHQIIEGHNGRIWVESEQGHGTSFTFALPYQLAEEAALA